MIYYNVIIKLLDPTKGSKGFVKYRNVTSLQRLKKYVEKHLGQWLFMTIYNAKNKQKIGVLSPYNIHEFEPLKTS
jgi:hypothetical protein